MASKVLRQEEVYRLTGREREAARLFEMKGGVASAISSLPNNLLSYLPLTRATMSLCDVKEKLELVDR
jgi:hypothetical protein